jgi:hypothetical protein
MEVGVIPPQLDKANPINAKKPIRNKSLFRGNAIPPDLETRLSRSQFAPAGLPNPAVWQRIWQSAANFSTEASLSVSHLSRFSTATPSTRP